MDLRLTEEQLALQETLRRFIARDYDFEQRRVFARSALGHSAQAWAQYAELGLLGLPYAEEFGGLGGDSVDIMAVMELIGRGLLLEPYLSTVVLCGGLLHDAAARPIKEALLPQIAAGKLRLALAAYERAHEPKRLEIFDGAHYDAYVAAFDQTSAAATSWFTQHLNFAR